MLTNDQCIKIAVKVWGWDPADCPYFKKAAEQLSTDSFEVEATDLLRAEVNSWQGFGRTVEAMEKIGYVFIADDVYVGFHPKELVRCQRHVRGLEAPKYQWSRQFTDDFIEETHLAALEALI